MLLVEASESFEKAELAAKEAPTDALERAATAPSRKTANPLVPGKTPTEVNPTKMKAQQNNTESHQAYLMSHGAFIMVSVRLVVYSIMYIFITLDIRFGFLARKPNLISSEFWGLCGRWTAIRKIHNQLGLSVKSVSHPLSISTIQNVMVEKGLWRSSKGPVSARCSMMPTCQHAISK
jgi:hypothetical protein